MHQRVAMLINYSYIHSGASELRKQPVGKHEGNAKAALGKFIHNVDVAAKGQAQSRYNFPIQAHICRRLHSCDFLTSLSPGWLVYVLWIHDPGIPRKLHRSAGDSARRRVEAIQDELCEEANGARWFLGSCVPQSAHSNPLRVRESEAALRYLYLYLEVKYTSTC